MDKITKAKISQISAMIIFGSIGLFARSITASSAALALFRSVLAVLFLVIMMTIKNERIEKAKIFANMKWLILSGIAIAGNWIFLFESYKYTSVAVATLCYYMAPIIVIILSPFALKEKLTIKKVICVIAAGIGMIGVSGALEGKTFSKSDIMGILLGLSAAALYATVMILNKKMLPMGSMERTASQLFIATIFMVIYIPFAGGFEGCAFSVKSIILILILGFFNTGFAYYLYFGAIGQLPAQTAAMISYFDPVVAVILSATVLKENITVFCIIGAVLIIGAALANEIEPKKHHE